MPEEVESKSAKQPGSRCSRSRNRPFNNAEEDGAKENQNGGQHEQGQQFKNNSEMSRANGLKLTMRRQTANNCWEIVNKYTASLTCVQKAVSIDIPTIQIFPNEPGQEFWGSMPYSEFTKLINDIYNKIVHFKRNIFKTSSGRAVKDFVRELCFWINSYLNLIALKAFMILPTILLQKPSPKSKAKDHTNCLTRRPDLLKKVEIYLLMREVNMIKRRFNSSIKPINKFSLN